MNLSLNNWNKPSHPFWKKFGDYALITIPVYTPIVLCLPIPNTFKMWLVSIMSCTFATAKLITKCTLDPNYVNTTIIQETGAGVIQSS
jgi:hypothetical protein